MNYDLLNDLVELKKELSKEGYVDIAEEVDRAISSSSVSTELMMKVRYVLEKYKEKKTLDKNIKLHIDNIVKHINNYLSP